VLVVTFDDEVSLVEDCKDEDKVVERVGEDDKELVVYEVDGFKLVDEDELRMIDELEVKGKGNVQLVRIMPKKGMAILKNLVVCFLSMIQ
jgi:uncharacterized Zn ribbon protein